VNALLELVCVRPFDYRPGIYVEFPAIDGKAEGERTVGRLWHRWEENIKVQLNTNRTGVCEMDLSGLGHGQQAVR